MGILDDIKPKPKKPRPLGWRTGLTTLHVDWDDGKSYDYPSRALRLACPCAGCVDEWSGKRNVDEASVKPGLMFTRAEETGRYALQITFSDTHGTGIFSWDYLRKLMETWGPAGHP